MSMMKLIKLNENQTKLAYTGLTTLSPSFSPFFPLDFLSLASVEYLDNAVRPHGLVPKNSVMFLVGIF